MSNAADTTISAHADFHLLRRGQRVTDSWTHLDDDADLPAEGDVFVSLDRFEQQRADLSARLGRTGVRLEPGHTGRELNSAHDEVDAIAVDFPKFTDGRGYTVARRLREQLGWTKELRATGDVLPDQVYYMQRVGFDTLQLRGDKSPASAIAALKAFSVRYQASADDARPLYRRRSGFKTARAS